MGATNFVTAARGKTMTAAFDDAVAHARWEYGHGGYTGTIAEKHGFVEMAMPRGVDAETFVRWVESYDYKPNAVPAEHRAAVARAHRVWTDKWGPAVGIELAKGEYVFFGMASD